MHRRKIGKIACGRNEHSHLTSRSRCASLLRPRRRARVTGLAAAGGKRRPGQRLLPLHPEARRAAVRRDTDGPELAQLVLRAVRGHMGTQQLVERRYAGAACRVWRGETDEENIIMTQFQEIHVALEARVFVGGK